MQPIGVDVGSGVLTPSFLAVAREAFFRRDFEVCIDALERATSLTPAERREASLLWARAAYRTRRYSDVAAFLGPILGTFVTVDETCTAKMLHATAIARSKGAGNIDRGLSLLDGLAVAAQELGAHRAILGEIAYMLALVHWMKRDYAAVLRYAAKAEHADADVISVRATSLRGYVALATERYREALELFRFALRAYRACRERDADLVLRIIVQIAALEVALRSATVAGTHALPDGGGRYVDDSAADVPGVLRMEIAALDAWLYAFDGDRKKAYRRVRVSERLAPNDAWRVWALANRAKISAALGDTDWASEYAAEALEISGRVDWNATDDEERVALLHLAEILALTDPPEAVRVLRRYDRLTTKVDRALLMHDDVRLWILETFVRALVHRIRGEIEQACEALQRVRLQAQRVGIRWREALALIELDAIQSEPLDHGERPLQQAAVLVREHFPRSFLARRLGRWSQTVVDPIAAKLAPQPRQVLRHVLTGKNPKEIAATMALSEDTVKGYTKTLFRAFSVNSTPQLLVACYERGLGSPSWWDALDESEAIAPRTRGHSKSARRAAGEPAG
jgi:ATP/maltotriose-dependent transcriptional regulator MalT